MIDVNCITLEDGNNYVVISNITHEENRYIYLVDEKNEKNFCIRKIITENNEEFIVPLESDQEFNKALILFKEVNM